VAEILVYTTKKGIGSKEFEYIAKTDINHDGITDCKDYRAIYQLQADLNEDGVINSDDELIISNVLKKNGTRKKMVTNGIDVLPEQEPEQEPEQTPEQTPEQEPGQTPEQTPEQEPGQTPEQIPTPVVQPAKVTDILYTDYKNYKQIDILFDKEINVTEMPEIAVIINNEVQNADYIGKSSDNKKISYRISYDKFGVMTSGIVNISIYGGEVVIKENPTVFTSLNGIKKEIGNLSSYKVSDIYKNIISKQAGDVNLDGEVNSIDASIVLRLSTYASVKGLTEEEKEQYKRADANGDGKVDSIDATEILSYAAKAGAGKNLKDVIKCDINKDKKIDKEDYNILKKSVTENTYDSIYDINEDKKINEDDISIFLKIVKDNGSR